MTQIDTHYADPRLAEIYDAGNGWSIDRDFYLKLAGPNPIRILDLGCGTGLLCDAYAARNHNVTGVDPAASMLEVARNKTHGHKIEWVLSPAQSYSSKNKYDLVIMTGHAFQVLLENEDALAAFRVMREHLAPRGQIVFESRNPEIDWASQWNRTAQLKVAKGEIKVERLIKKRDGNRIHFDTFYHFSQETLISQSELRFWTYEEINHLLKEAGLKLKEFYGDWDKSSFIPKSSEEMIFVVQGL